MKSHVVRTFYHLFEEFILCTEDRAHGSKKQEQHVLVMGMLAEGFARIGEGVSGKSGSLFRRAGSNIQVVGSGMGRVSMTMVAAGRFVRMGAGVGGNGGSLGNSMKIGRMWSNIHRPGNVFLTF